MEEKKKVILIADGDKENREFLAKVFSDINFTVYMASSGSEVIQRVQSTPVNVLIMDVELKGIKGYEINSYFKKNRP
ncbi:response regulator [Candidatus Aerophobetes bacterium]|nr:response regulator [Candidatus Aerophobetes bacterium]